jgi:hypothetical protein
MLELWQQMFIDNVLSPPAYAGAEPMASPGQGK